MASDIKTQDYSIYIDGSGNKIFNDISSNFKFIHILNNTGFAVTVKGNGETIMNVPIYTMMVVPIPQSILATGRPNYDIAWSGTSSPATLRVIFADEVLFPGMTLVSPGGSSTVIIAGQAAGLATEDKQDDILVAIANVGIGQSTAANQNDIKALLATIDGTVSGVSTAARQDAMMLLIDGLEADTNTIANTAALISTKLDLIQQRAGVPTVLNLSLAAANTEYSAALPAGTKIISAWIEGGGADYRLAWEPGKVAGSVRPYLAMGTGDSYYIDGINLAAGTLYAASATAGKILVIECWV